MIWVRGAIVPDDALSIAATDRTFEHGIGLFETLRTWNGVPALLPRHLARMSRSAAELGLPLDPGSLPDEDAVARLRDANRDEGDVLVRITATAGRSDRDVATLWMRRAPLPPPPPESGAVVVRAPWTLAVGDPLARHKTLNYWSRRLAHDQGRASGADEVLFATPDDRIWEGSRMNVFLIHGATLTTPDLDGPILPGIMRGLVLELAGKTGLQTRERGVKAEDFETADEVFLTNAVRGVVPVGHMPGRFFEVPGPWTRRLSTAIEACLQRGQVYP